MYEQKQSTAVLLVYKRARAANNMVDLGTCKETLVIYFELSGFTM